jgi:hypothetical protein
LVLAERGDLLANLVFVNFKVVLAKIANRLVSLPGGYLHVNIYQANVDTVNVITGGLADRIAGEQRDQTKKHTAHEKGPHQDGSPEAFSISRLFSRIHEFKNGLPGLFLRLKVILDLFLRGSYMPEGTPQQDVIDNLQPASEQQRR